MKNSRYILGVLFIISATLQLKAQFIPGHSDITYNSLANPGLSIKNKNAGPIQSSLIRIYNDMDRRLDIGIRSSGFNPDAHHNYIQALDDTPLDIIIGSLKRVEISTEGFRAIGDPNSTDTVAQVEVTHNGLSDIIAFTATSAPNGFSSNWGIGADFRGGYRGVRGFTEVGIGVVGEAIQGRGVVGGSRDTSGVEGFSQNNHGIVGSSGDPLHAGVFGFSINAAGTGVNGQSISGKGVHGLSNSGTGVHGISTSASGVKGESTNGVGLEGSSSNNDGVYGTSDNVGNAGVRGEGRWFGVIGKGKITGYGVLGISEQSHGVVSSATQNGANNNYDFYATGTAMDYGSSSSKRWKTNIQNIDQAIQKLTLLRGVYYDWDEAHGGRHDIGFIAEEVGAVLPEIVSYEENGVDAIAMDYSKVTALLVEAVNQLKLEYDAKFKKQAREIEKLKSLLSN